MLRPPNPTEQHTICCSPCTCFSPLNGPLFTQMGIAGASENPETFTETCC